MHTYSFAELKTQFKGLIDHVVAEAFYLDSDFEEIPLPEQNPGRNKKYNDRELVKKYVKSW
jgi:hypothetical protein